MTTMQPPVEEGLGQPLTADPQPKRSSSSTPMVMLAFLSGALIPSIVGATVWAASREGRVNTEQVDFSFQLLN